MELLLLIINTKLAVIWGLGATTVIGLATGGIYWWLERDRNKFFRDQECDHKCEQCSGKCDEL